MIHVIIFLLILFGTLCMYVHARLSCNRNRHHTDEYEFAHFSPITESNKSFFPTYGFTSPLHFVISEGEALVIPKNWWHWVQSDPNTVAVSYWNKSSLQVRPKILRMPKSGQVNLKTIASNRLSSKDQHDVQVWDSSKNIITTKMENSGGCIITLPGYFENELDQKMNKQILYDILPHLEYPPLPGWDRHNTDANLWYAIGFHDTGLHYDDYDGVLHVLQGRKHIRLFPPSQSKHLLPYSVTPKWASGPAECVAYNKYQSYGQVRGWPSARLLYESVRSKNNKQVLLEIRKAVRDATQPHVWGCKWQDGVMRWELYEYFYDRFDHLPVEKADMDSKSPCIIKSIDFFDRDDPVGNMEHFYYSDQGWNLKLPFYGSGTQKQIGSSGPELHEGVFVYDTAESWKINYSKYIRDLNFPKEVIDCVHLLNAYECSELCVWNKGSNTIFVQYLGITIHDFVTFLRTFEYPAMLVEHVEENSQNYESIPHEITIVYDIATKQPVRSSFYGIV